MTYQQVQNLIQDLQALPKEYEWVEFKIDNVEPHTIGENGGSIFKESIVALKNDQICFFQEFGSSNIIQIGYDNITKTSFGEKEVEEYIALKKSREEKKKEPLIKVFKKSQFQNKTRNSKNNIWNSNIAVTWSYAIFATQSVVAEYKTVVEIDIGLNRFSR